MDYFTQHHSNFNRIIDAEIERWKDYLAQGKAVDYPRYKEIAGNIAALNAAKGFYRDAANQLLKRQGDSANVAEDFSNIGNEPDLSYLERDRVLFDRQQRG